MGGEGGVGERGAVSECRVRGLLSLCVSSHVSVHSAMKLVFAVLLSHVTEGGGGGKNPESAADLVVDLLLLGIDSRLALVMFCCDLGDSDWVSPVPRLLENPVSAVLVVSLLF